MTKRRVTNVAASIRQRLSNAARSSGRPFQEVLQYYAMERFLYRLAQSPHAERFVLKGALMLHAWGAPASRPTKDIDLLGYLAHDAEALAAVVKAVCAQAVEPDGLVFERESVVSEVIKQDADYAGVRVTIRATLENARIGLQIDIGFGDVVYPSPELADYPTILDHAAPRLRGYPRETMIAEKFEAMVKLGLVNSRMKDFYDLWYLSRQFDFEGVRLTTAIERTFAHRGARLEPDPTALSAEFASDAGKRMQWQAFLRRSRLSNAPTELAVVTAVLRQFLSPPVAALAAGRPFEQRWQPHGPWIDE